MSSPVDFLGLADPFINLYLRSPELQALGSVPGEYSRNCSSCGGRGSVKIDMGFLPAASRPCETCGGSGFSPEARRARMMGISLPELFAMGLEEAKTFLSSLPELEELSSPLRALEAAGELGLGYLALNQPGRSLSGGEAQRLKIVSELLSKKQTQSSLFILDEPTVGQHMEDVERLASALRSLRGGNRSVLVVEHNAQLLAACDWLIEMGPGGGPEGGLVIAEGQPENLAAGKTPIAPYLREMLKGAGVS
jgi:excinuclease ABC subunit A